MTSPDTIDTFLDETLKPLGRLRGATTEESSILQKVDFETAKSQIQALLNKSVLIGRIEMLKTFLSYDENQHGYIDWDFLANQLAGLEAELGSATELSPNTRQITEQEDK